MRRGRPPHNDILTPREWEVLALMEEGLLNEQIARRLGISYGGAKYHVAEILSKLGVNSREEAVAWARSGRERRRALPLLGWLTARLPTSLPTKLAAGTALIGAAALVAILLGALPGRRTGDSALAPAGLAIDGVSADQFLTSIPSLQPPEPGQVIYRRTEVYERYGPKAPDIAAVTGVPVESHVFETWLETGPRNTIARAYGRWLDESGQAFKVSTTLAGINRQWDPRTGRVILEMPIPMADALAEPDFTAFLELLTHGWAQVLSQTEADLVIESTYDRAFFEWTFKENQLPERFRISDEERIASALQQTECGPGCMGTPFFGDLNAQALVTRTTIRNDGQVLLEERYVLTPGGERVLVASWRQTHYEVIEAIPPEVLDLVP